MDNREKIADRLDRYITQYIRDKHSNMPNPKCEALTFRPSMEEFSHQAHYMDQIEAEGAHRGGICKIIPPQEWKDELPSTYEVKDMVIPNIKQDIKGHNGIYTVYNQNRLKMKVKDLHAHKKVKNGHFLPSHEDSIRTVVDKYWDCAGNEDLVTYGADVSGSLFSEKVKIWNVAQMGTLLDTLKIHGNTNIEGVTTSYLYFGTWRSTFPIHTEDSNANSISYLHYGLPKVWYSVAPEHGELLERYLAPLYSGMKQKCKGYIRHKMSLVSPTQLKQAGIPYNMIVQNAGEFIVTFPYGYHWGFNVGFNCAEATNFATKRWINYGKNWKSDECICSGRAVPIPMDLFVKLFQTPEEYKYWLEHGKGSPIDHAYCSPPPAPIEQYRSWAENIDLKMARHNEYLEKAGKRPITVKQFLKRTTTLIDADMLEYKDDKPYEHNRVDACERKGVIKNGDSHSSIADEVLVRLEKYEEKASNEDKALESVRKARKDSSTKFLEEVRLNEEQGRLAPYCSVCHVVHCSMKLNVIFNDSPARVNELIRDEKSRFPQSNVLIPENAFEMKKDFKSNTEADASMMKKFTDQTCDVTSPLLDCEKCNVRIHAKCWGLSKEKLDNLEKHPKEKWRCDRCEENPRKAVCFICNKITGALKKDGNGKRPKWVHVECILGTPGVFFENVERREGVNMSKLDKKPVLKKNSQCIYCDDTLGGHPVQCSLKVCRKVHFHVTCARDNGHLIKTGIWPDSLYLFCKECEEGYLRDHEKEEAQSLNIGEKVKVIAGGGCPHKDAVISCHVKTVVHHQANFDDGTIRKDLYQEDLINHDWKNYPEIASSIQVKLPDGLVYRATYRGFTKVNIYKVTYPSKKTGTFTRHELLDQYEAENQTKREAPSSRKSKMNKAKMSKAKKRKQAAPSSDEEDDGSSATSTSKSSVAKPPPAKKSNGSSTRKKKSKTPKGV